MHTMRYMTLSLKMSGHISCTDYKITMAVVAMQKAGPPGILVIKVKHFPYSYEILIVPICSYCSYYFYINNISYSWNWNFLTCTLDNKIHSYIVNFDSLEDFVQATTVLYSTLFEMDRLLEILFHSTVCPCCHTVVTCRYLNNLFSELFNNDTLNGILHSHWRRKQFRRPTRSHITVG